MHLYLIQSPLQAINAFEARQAIADGEERHEVIVFEQKEKLNNELLKNTLAALGWEPWLVVPFDKSKVAKVIRWLRLRKRLRRLREVNRCYLGSYDAGMGLAAANFIKGSSFYLLDDGTSTHNFTGFRYENRRPQHLPPSTNIPWLGYDTALPPQLTFFSLYDVELRPPDQRRTNELTFLRKELELDPSGPVFFIGSCLPDVEVISFDQFFALFRAVKEWFGDKEIYYFPHRRELMNRKKVFFDWLGVKIMEPMLPFELEITRGNLRPCKIATFYSTALDTLRLISRGQKGVLLAFGVPEDWIVVEAHREIAQRAYRDYHESSEIGVVEKDFLGSII